MPTPSVITQQISCSEKIYQYTKFTSDKEVSLLSPLPRWTCVSYSPQMSFYQTLLQTSLEMISVPRVLSKTFQEIEGLKEPCPLLIAARGGSAKEVLKSSLWWWVQGGIGELDSYRPRTRVMTWPARTVTPFMVFWSMWRGLTYRPKASGFLWHRQQQNIQE